MNINSKEYWDERFDTNWLDYAGDKQTLFFAELLCGMLPQSLVNEIREKEYSVCDLSLIHISRDRRSHHFINGS